MSPNKTSAPTFHVRIQILVALVKVVSRANAHNKQQRPRRYFVILAKQTKNVREVFATELSKTVDAFSPADLSPNVHQTLCAFTKVQDKTNSVSLSLEFAISLAHKARIALKDGLAARTDV